MESEIRAGYKIEVEQDLCPIEPRDYEPLGRMVLFHKHYDLPKEIDNIPDPASFSGWDELGEAIRKQTQAVVMLDVYMYDHSGVTIRTTPFSCPWDSGQVGFILARAEDIRKEYKVKAISAKLKAKVEAMLESEVKEYAQYMEGDIWQWAISRDGEIIESCGGTYGYDEALKQARAMTDIIAHEHAASVPALAE